MKATSLVSALGALEVVAVELAAQGEYTPAQLASLVCAIDGRDVPSGNIKAALDLLSVEQISNNKWVGQDIADAVRSSSFGALRERMENLAAGRPVSPRLPQSESGPATLEYR